MVFILEYYYASKSFAVVQEHLEMHILTSKYRIRQQYTDNISGHKKCLRVTRANGATKQLKHTDKQMNKQTKPTGRYVV